MIQLDFSVLTQIILFIGLWLILRRVLFEPYMRLLQNREQRTDGLQAQAETLTREGQQLQAEYEAAIARAREEGESIKNEIRGEAEQARERIVSEGQSIASQTLQAVRQEIARDMTAARERTAKEAEALASEMVEKVLGRKIA